MSDLIDQLQKKPFDFDFFQAVSLLEEYFSKKHSLLNPLTEGHIQFSSDPSTIFPSSDISHIKKDEKSGKIHFLLTFMGLLGVSSPLPQYFIENGTEKDGITNSALVNFLTIFEHRMYVLFYQAWKKYRLSGMFSGNDPFNVYEKIALIAGIPREKLQKAQRLVGYAGILSVSCRSSEGLKTMLSDYFGSIPVEIIPWIPRWVKVAQLKKIGYDSVLGMNAMIGTHIRDVSGKFRIVIGPLEKETFQKFLPESENIIHLQEVVNDYLTDSLEFDIEVKLKSADLTIVILGKDNAQLGVTTSCGTTRDTIDSYSILIE